MKRLTLLPLLLVALLALGGAGCNSFFGGDTQSADPETDLYDDAMFADLSQSLEDPDGGYTMNDEAPGFGDASFMHMFQEAHQVQDGMMQHHEVQDMLATPGAEVHYVRLLWGQLAGNPDIDTVTDWGGSISVDRGAIVVLRRIAFEPLTDWVVFPREDIKVVDLYSLTTTHYDGLLLQVIDPTPELDTPNDLTIALGPGQGSVSVAALNGLERVIDVDELGNQLSLQSPEPLDCPNGFLAGVWARPMHGDDAERGIFRGAFLSYEGRLLGHLRGFWGVTEDGERAFRGKWIALDGSFRGILRGTWAPDDTDAAGIGSFEGIWVDETETVQGTLAGQFRTGRGRGGFFAGRWLDESCSD